MTIQQMMLQGAVDAFSGIRAATNITAGTDSGYDGYVLGTAGSIDSDAIIGANAIVGLTDTPEDTEFTVTINADSDPGESFLTDVEIDYGSIWGDYLYYDYAYPLATWHFNPQGIVPTTLYTIYLIG